jgi:hypothetical protein
MCRDGRPDRGAAFPLWSVIDRRATVVSPSLVGSARESGTGKARAETPHAR